MEVLGWRGWDFDGLGGCLGGLGVSVEVEVEGCVRFKAFGWGFSVEDRLRFDASGLVVGVGMVVMGFPSLLLGGFLRQPRGGMFALRSVEVLS